MNKKIYAGLMSLGIATTFWACGSGDIVKFDLEGSDGIMIVQTDPEDITGLATSTITRESCPECFVGAVVSSSSVAPKPRSSSSIFIPTFSSVVQQSSSSFEINLSSSSSFIYDPGSSSSRPPYKEVSSSSVAPSNTGGGTCAPLEPIVDQGKPVVWKYTVGGIVKTTDMLSAQLKWSTPGGSPEALDGKGAKFMSDTVLYATSGQHTATLILATSKGSFSINCDPVQVNGAKITGCKCTSASKSVDFTATPDVSWSVSGCTTGAGLTLSYEWDGIPGDTSYTKNFTAANEGYVPKLMVKNNDNTVIEVKTCPAVKITDGPEYQITTTQGVGAIDLPKGTSAVVVNVNNDGYVFCKIDRVKANSSTGAFSGTINKVPISGQDYKEVQVIAGGIPVGTTLMFDIDVPLTCGVR